jgi:hypothetical protein
LHLHFLAISRIYGAEEPFSIAFGVVVNNAIVKPLLYEPLQACNGNSVCNHEHF